MARGFDLCADRRRLALCRLGAGSIRTQNRGPRPAPGLGDERYDAAGTYLLGTGAGTPDAPRQRRRIGGENLLDPDIVQPARVEVVLVIEALVLTKAELTQLERRGPGKALKRPLPLYTIMPAADTKPMQMLVFPAHRRLKNVMQVPDRTTARNEQSAPNRWTHPAQADAQLIDPIEGIGQSSEHAITSSPRPLT